MAATKNAVAAMMVELTARFAKFESSMQQASTRFGRTVKEFKKLGGELSKNLSLPFAGAAVAAYKASLKMDDALDKIAISTGKTGKALQGLESDFNAVFTGKAAEAPLKVASAIGELNTRLGLTGKPLQELATQILVVSRLTETDLNSNIKLSAQLFNQWQVSTEDQSKTLDLMNSASQKTGVNFNQLLGTVIQFGPIFRTAGFSLEQATALLGNFEKTGVDTGKVIAGLTFSIRKLAQAGVKDIPAALNQLITDLKATGNESLALKRSMDLFGKSGAVVFQAIKSGAFDIQSLQQALAASEGSVERTRAQTDGLSQTLTTLGNSVLAAAAPIESALNDALKALEPLLLGVIGKLNTAAKWFQSLSTDTKAAAVGIGAVLTAAGPAAFIIASVITGVTNLAKALRLLTSAVLLNPFVVLSATLFTIYKLVQTDAFKRGLDVLTKGFFDFGVTVANSIKAASDAIATFFGDAFTRIQADAQKIVDVAAQIYEGIKTHLVDRFTALGGDFQRGLDVIYNAFANLKARLLDHSPIKDIDEQGSEHFEHLKETAITATKTATSTVGGLWDALGKKTKAGTDKAAAEAKKLAAALDSAFESIKRAVFDVNDPLDEFTQKLFDAVKSKDLKTLQSLAQKFITTSDKANDFATALQAASEKNKQLAEDTKEVEKIFQNLEQTTADLENQLTPLASEVYKFLKKGDIQGAKDWAKALLEGGKSLQEVSTAVSYAEQKIESLREASYNAASGMADSFGKLAIAFGAPQDGISALVDGFQELIKLQEKLDKGLGGIGFADTFEQLGNLFSGDINAKGFNDLADSFANIAKAAASIIEPLAAMGKDGGANDLQQGAQAGLAAIGAGVGAFFGGPAGAAVGGQIGSSLGALIPGLVDTDSAEHEGRKVAEQYIEGLLAGVKAQFFNSEGLLQLFDNNILRGDESAFDSDWAAQFQAMGDGAVSVFGGLGNALKELLGITEDVGGQIGFILANTFAGNIDNARLLVMQLGLDFEQLSGALLQAALKGTISWHEYAVQLQGLGEAFEPGLAALGDMTGAVDNLINSGGRGLVAIKSLRDIAIEATEAGVKDLDGLRAHLLASGKYTVQQIDQIFSALGSQGITSLDQLMNVTDATAGQIVANLQSIGFEFQNSEQAAAGLNAEFENADDKADEILNKLKDWPEEVRTKVIIEEVHESSGGGGGGGGSSNGGDSSSDSATSKLARSIGRQVTKAATSSKSPSSSKSSGKSKNKKASQAEQDAAKKAAEEVISALVNVFPNLDFGSGDSFSLTNFQSFFADVAAKFDQMSGAGRNMATSLSNALRDTLDLTDDAASKLSMLFGQQFGDNIDMARHYVGLMNFDFEELSESLANMAKQGKITWAEFASQFAAVTDMFKPGIQNAGAYGQALDGIWASGGSGFDAIQSVRDLGIEALEAQITSVDALKAALIALGRPADQVSKIFDQLAALGITTTEELAQVTDVVAGQIVGNAANAGFNFSQASTAATAAAAPAVDAEEQRLRDRLANAPSSYHRKQRQKELDAYLAQRMATKGFAKGGVVNSPSSFNLGGSIGRMAEFAKEGIMPLASVGGKLGVHAVMPAGKANSEINVSYVVNAPGAAPGEAERIEQAMRRVHDSAVKVSVAKVADMVRRGGSYSDAIRGR